MNGYNNFSYELMQANFNVFEYNYGISSHNELLKNDIARRL